NCYLVEGYTDVIQFHQSGIENVVASSGTALTPDQIRLINRLTKNITVLFDGDAAGLRASIRGIDLILEEGMNVKVCTFPDGDDPDSFARKNSYEDLVLYLETNAKDFIQFKASLLMDEAQNDPIKKADLIRDMVVSISKIPDRIKREVYIQECSRIMDISEQVLLNTLAQLVQKDISEANRQLKQEQKAFEVVKNENQVAQQSVDIVYELERKLIEILLLYGNIEEEFEDMLLKVNEEGETIEVSERSSFKVFQRIYLSLQEDEIELANETFKKIYNDLITLYNQENFTIENYLQQLDNDHSQIVTTILMNEEKEALHNWETKQIYVKSKHQSIAQYVTETIVSLREYLINKLIVEMMNQIPASNEEQIEEIKANINDYNKLKVYLTNKVGRIRSTYY
ncbi:toprim domain-containing protein, partial [Flavobacterium sp.]|uniref:toprim domain-containing protein n=1 Tax=Flavobacterium sp. TaxID=239 RepID=UPI0035B4DEBC